MIVNNVAGLAGGGISLQDAVAVRIVHNTIANNDSLATAGEAFAPGSPNQSTPQPGAGIVTRAHSAQLAAASGAIGTFSDPVVSTTTSSGRTGSSSSGWTATSGCTPGDPGCTSTYGLCPDVSQCRARLPRRQHRGLRRPGGHRDRLDRWSAYGTICISTGGSDPLFVAEYFNGAPLDRLPAGDHHRHPDAGGLRRGRQLHPSRAIGPLSLYRRCRAERRRPGHRSSATTTS